MADNKDIAALAKKIYELSVLPLAELEAHKWEALLILNAVHSSATSEGIAQTNAEKEARWGAPIKEAGLLSALHPKWLLRTDDGKPPAVRFALISALDNPHRDLQTRLTALLLVLPADREPLRDLVRALNADAWNGATVDARLKYSARMRDISKTWTKDPWLTIIPHDGSSPISILLDNQGVINDGGMFDKDATDDPVLATAWSNAIRTWDINFLRDNPLAQLFTHVENAASAVVETAGEVAGGANQAAKGVAKLLAWMPYVLGGIGAVGATVFIVAMASRSSPPAPTLQTQPLT